MYISTGCEIMCTVASRTNLYTGVVLPSMKRLVDFLS